MCVCGFGLGGKGHGESVVGYYIPQIEHSPSGSNSSVMCAVDSRGPFAIAIPLYVRACDVHLEVHGSCDQTQCILQPRE